MTEKQQGSKREQGNTWINEGDQEHTRNREHPSKDDEGFSSESNEIINDRAPDEFEHPGDVDNADDEGGEWY